MGLAGSPEHQVPPASTASATVDPVSGTARLSSFQLAREAASALRTQPMGCGSTTRSQNSSFTLGTHLGPERRGNDRRGEGFARGRPARAQRRPGVRYIERPTKWALCNAKYNPKGATSLHSAVQSAHAHRIVQRNCTYHQRRSQKSAAGVGLQQH